MLPPWVAFRLAPSWRATLLISAAIGLVAYISSFALAIAFDQPYGPVLVLMLLIAALGRLLPAR